jgi:hypothetical protein
MRLAAGVLLLAVLPTAAQPANERFLKWMDSIAQRQLAERDRVVSAIQTPEQRQHRRQFVRAKLLELIGGLPGERTPLNARSHWTKHRGAYVIEGISYESLPGLVVTANLYRPSAPGRYPAILHPMGHWELAKAAAQTTAANLAMKGLVVLAFDPIGQGERQQSWDARMGRSILGGPTEQHFMPGALATLAGENIARYFIWDGMRGIDYLQTRPEVDPRRIGCTGCSGGGTQTTYISALDERVQVAAPSCYMQSFKLLFSGTIGDSEQSFPNFLSSGLDQTDYVELFWPKPWLISSTEEDFFRPAAAKLVFEEARSWYFSGGHEDRLKWVVGPGPHGTPLEVREALYDWFVRWLRNGTGSASPDETKEQKVDLLPDRDLAVFPNALVPGRELYQLLQEKADRASTVIPALPAEPYVTDQMLLAGGPIGVVAVETGPLPGKRALALQAQGATVLALNPRGLPITRYPQLSGDWASNERAWLIGKNLPLMRAADIADAARSLAKRPGIRSVRVHAQGVAGWWAIYAAAHEPVIERTWVDRTPHSIRAAFDQPAHMDLHDVIIPGVIPQAAPSVRLLWSDPADWMRNVIKLPGAFRYRNVTVDEDDSQLIRDFLATP